MEDRLARRFVIACAGAVGFVLMYALVDYARLPRVWHDQVARSFRWDTVPRGPQPAGYPGALLWSLALGLAAAGLAALILKLYRKPLSTGALGLWTAWTLSAFLLVGGYFTWNLWP